MEARQTLAGSAVPKGLVALLAISIAIALAAVGSLVARDMAGSNASVNRAVHAAPGTVLRQDNPVQAAPALLDRGAEGQSSAPAGTHIGRSSGTQSIEGSDGAVKATTPKANVDQMPGFRF
ncbi:MAG TPA: hypothetical protein VLK30_06495 [Candidatus Limnocylindrales bacterium]|nr:hypothetical protein [Candidatus Limnocylindrales bacterium]